MRTWVICIGLLGVFVAPSSLAEQLFKSGEYKASVVELYTSEGCSSCPPADKFLSRLGNTDEADQTILLAFHVDYWDYIGWKDPYAKTDYTQRQRVVARVNGQSTIYTPEFVVDGVEARGIHKVVDKISAAHRSPAEADITLILSDINDDRLVADVSVYNLTYTGEDTPEVFLVVYESGLSGQIKAGENRGRTLYHDYVVRYLSLPQTTMSGRQHQFELQLGREWRQSQLGVAAVVKLSKSGRTLQAVKGML